LFPANIAAKFVHRLTPQAYHTRPPDVPCFRTQLTIDAWRRHGRTRRRLQAAVFRSEPYPKPAGGLSATRVARPARPGNPGKNERQLRDRGPAQPPQRHGLAAALWRRLALSVFA